MCGIIGFFSEDDTCKVTGNVTHGNAIESVLDGLTKLEYRGYDSAGLAYIEDTKVKVIKAVGHAEQLIQKTKDINPPDDCRVAIGHTRWATHGGANELNAHPHLSNNNEIAVVHNGIIENYVEIIEFLAGHGIKMRSETDTEVIPNLIQIYYQGDLKKAIQKALKHLKGSYAFVAIAAGSPNTLVCVKKGMPLCIGSGKNFYIITSDIPTALTRTENIYIIENNEMAVINAGEIDFYQNNKPIEKLLIKPPHSRELITKGPFKTFMEKEINDIPEVFQRLITQTSIPSDMLEILRNATAIHICACGTSYHAGLVIGALIEKHCKIRVKNHIASELRFTEPLILGTDIGLVLSQSGETADTISAMHVLKENNIPVIAICNTPNSFLAREADHFLPTLAGFEIAVPSTKSYCAQLLLGAILVNELNKHQQSQDVSLQKTCDEAIANIPQKSIFSKNAFSLLPMHARSILAKDKDIAAIAAKYKDKSRIFFIGKGISAFISLEAAMKVKGISYIQCEGFPAGELKHGPLTLVDNETLTAVFQIDDSTKLKTENAAAEVKARGSKIWAIEVPASPLSFCYAIIPAQLFALHLCILKGHNPDKPRNLAKAVSVE